MRNQPTVSVSVEVSARHVHLDIGAFETLFGIGAKLSLKRDLSQPGQFASSETVMLKTQSGLLENVRILGPLRDYCQVELSKTEARILGLDPPIRRSHELDLDGTPGLTIVGPQGEIHVDKGVIIPWRHLHVSNTEALDLKLAAGSLISVRISGERATIFEHVLVHMYPSFHLSVHLDTDEGNAAGVSLHTKGEILPW